MPWRYRLRVLGEAAAWVGGLALVLWLIVPRDHAAPVLELAAPRAGVAALGQVRSPECGLLGTVSPRLQQNASRILQSRNTLFAESRPAHHVLALGSIR